MRLAWTDYFAVCADDVFLNLGFHILHSSVVSERPFLCHIVGTYEAQICWTFALAVCQSFSQIDSQMSEKRCVCVNRHNMAT